MAKTHDNDTTEAPRLGRPPKVDAEGRPTRERLLAAAAAACVEHGFEGATLTDIAQRADVSPPAIYNHFSGKSDLLVEACRWALSRMRPDNEEGEESPQPAGTSGPIDPLDVVRTYLSPDFADARTLQLELHLASLRHPDVRDLLAKWHGDNAELRTRGGATSVATVKTWYLLLLGLAHVDALSSLDAPVDDVIAQANRLAQTLFDTPR